MEGLPDPEIVALIQHLGSCHKSVRRSAEAALIARQDDCVDTLVTLLDEEARRRRRRRAILWCICIAALATQFAIILLPHSVMLWMQRTTVGITCNLVLWMLSHASILFSVFGGASLRHQGAAGVLAKCDNLRLVGPLIEAGEVNPEAHIVLARLLPTLRASDAALINKTQRAILNRHLASRAKKLDSLCTEDAAYLTAVLKGLEQVGDGDAVKAVAQIADAKANCISGQKIRDAARECLPYLQSRAEQHELSSSLLRAASSATSPAELVRAAGPGRNDTDQLLRGASAEVIDG